MENATPGTLEREGAAALARMEEALQLLDACEGGDDAGAHLDLAICRLKEALAISGAAPMLATAKRHLSRRPRGR
jgi:hypothetical protein